MGKRLLIADDSQNTRGILRFMLANQGFELLEAENGEAALEKARTGAPDLIILDGMMPGKSGFEACRELKEDPRTCRIPVILLSAIAQTDPDHDWSKESSADRFMAKPFRMDELVAVIQTLLGLPASGETARRQMANAGSQPLGTAIRPKKQAAP